MPQFRSRVTSEPTDADHFRPRVFGNDAAAPDFGKYAHLRLPLAGLLALGAFALLFVR